jgi:F-type H+-transporting ATPase subunit delta
MERRVARRYARALLNRALQQHSLPDVSEDLGALAGLFRTNGAFRNMMLAPVGDHLAKADAVAGLAGRASPTTLDFLRLVIDKRREHVLPEIQQEFEELKRQHEGVAVATVVSAVPLDGVQMGSIVARLEQRTGLRVEAEFEVDPDIVGGVKVLIGDTLIDGSVRGRLKEMRARLFRDVLMQV